MKQLITLFTMALFLLITAGAAAEEEVTTWKWTRVTSYHLIIRATQDADIKINWGNDASSESEYFGGGDTEIKLTPPAENYNAEYTVTLTVQTVI